MPFVVGGSLAGPSIGIGGGQGLDVKAKVDRQGRTNDTCLPQEKQSWVAGGEAPGRSPESGRGDDFWPASVAPV